ncbi:hypothetical protein Dimus_028476 [Dionaea muscipula]
MAPARCSRRPSVESTASAAARFRRLNTGVSSASRCRGQSRLSFAARRNRRLLPRHRSPVPPSSGHVPDAARRQLPPPFRETQRRRDREGKSEHVHWMSISQQKKKKKQKKIIQI